MDAPAQSAPHITCSARSGSYNTPDLSAKSQSSTSSISLISAIQMTSHRETRQTAETSERSFKTASKTVLETPVHHPPASSCSQRPANGQPVSTHSSVLA
eukprot:GFYU01009849.1.p2 GENE.GFYU01009849.1~~GFYU01009849.1.p2  ORF type:complete len:100 (-),score=8.95 GFYU01009849.1:119-418(-)